MIKFSNKLSNMILNTERETGGDTQTCLGVEKGQVMI